MSTPVEEIKERLNIVDVVQEYVSLKRAGANHKGQCPFHNEKTPSFTVSEGKQFFHCFGCGKGGDVFTFIELVEGMEFAEALRVLARKANVELRPTNPREHNERTRLLDALKLASEFFHVALKESKEGQVARDYLERRGVNQDTVEHFGIGYSGDSWDALLNFLKKKGYKEKEIEKAGLIVPSQKTGGWYDRFRGRLMFPIYNAHGNVIGFGGRTLDPEQKEAKYINSPQTAVYNKSAVLYGLHSAKQFIQKMDATVIVEGYMDVVTAYQATFRNVVAASGTALTHDQIRLLKRYSNNVILAFDADAAGLSAAWKGMQVAVQEGMNIKVLVLPTGKDPDDLIREDPAAFRQRAVEAKPFMEHAFDTVLQPLDLTNVLHKKKAAAELLPMIAMFPDRIEQTHYIKKLATALGVDHSVLEEKLQRKPATPAPKKEQSPPPTNSERVITRGEQITDQLMALILTVPEEFPTVAEKLHEESLESEKARTLYKKCIELYNRSGSLQPHELKFEHAALDATTKEYQLIGEELFGELSAKERQRELLTLITSAERYRVKQRLQRVEKQLAAAEQTNDTETIMQLSEEFRALTETLRQLG